MRAPVTALTALIVSCATPPTPAPVAPPTPPPIVKGAAGDRDLRVMIAEIAANKACSMVEHQFRTLRAKTPDRPVIGAMWLRDCKIVHDGARLNIEVAGRGWEWVDRETKKAGATFHVHQYVKFELRAVVTGDVDVAYDPRSHVGTLWLTPVGPPDVTMKALGDVDVDREGVWADLIGALGTATGHDPDRQGEHKVAEEGTKASTAELAKGMTMTMNLCNGLSHMVAGRLPRGIYGPAGPGETRRAPITIYPQGLLLFPPAHAPDGLTIKLDSQGPVRIGLACRDQAEAAAAAFLEATPVAPKLLADQVVTGKATLSIGPQRCLVSVVAMSVLPTPVTFDYERPLAEAAQATQGPLIRCDKPATR